MTERKRQTYTMTQADFDELLAQINVARETPLILLQCGMPESPQEAANRAWEKLGRKMGFVGMTVRPHESGNQLMFTAEPRT